MGRIDHLLLSPSIVDRLGAADVDRKVRGWEKASDHAPAWIELKEAAKTVLSSGEDERRALGGVADDRR
jgi:hypothetical protein